MKVKCWTRGTTDQGTKYRGFGSQEWAKGSQRVGPYLAKGLRKVSPQLDARPLTRAKYPPSARQSGHPKAGGQSRDLRMLPRAVRSPVLPASGRSGAEAE